MPAAPPEHRVFVYGTLRRGGGAAHLLEGARFEGEATVRGTLFVGPGYPVLVLQGSAGIQGEIWRCNAETLAALDAWEGVDEGLFVRSVCDAGGEQAWVYLAGPRLRPRLGQLPTVPDGDWIAHLRRSA